MFRISNTKLLCLFLFCLCMPVDAKTIANQKIVGVARVRDGDSLRIGRKEIRLYGVDAFELEQHCGRMACGKLAKNFMRAQIEGKVVVCLIKDRDQYARYVAVCKTQDGRDLGALLVLQGLGVAYRSFSDDYIDEERAAKASKAGAWGSGFQSPLNYRRNTK